MPSTLRSLLKEFSKIGILEASDDVSTTLTLKVCACTLEVCAFEVWIFEVWAFEFCAFKLCAFEVYACFRLKKSNIVFDFSFIYKQNQEKTKNFKNNFHKNALEKNTSNMYAKIWNILIPQNESLIYMLF